MAPTEAFYCFATFNSGLARPPPELLLPENEDTPHTILDDLRQEKECAGLLDLRTRDKPSHQSVSLGGGSGFAYAATPYSHFHSKDGVSVLLAGEVSAWPGIDMVQFTHNAFVRGEEASIEDDADWLLKFYDTFRENTESCGSLTEAALSSLAQLKGSFAFVLYDAELQRVLVARDVSGAQPLYWGCTQDGRLLFSSSASDLDACNPTATPFPAGSLFSSESGLVAESPGEMGWVIAGDTRPGRLLSFVHKLADQTKWRDVKAIPRITSKGALCGAVYRVASERNLMGAGFGRSEDAQARFGF